MGLFEKVFGQNTEKKKEYSRAMATFKLLTPYAPAFTSWDGAIYEAIQCRAAINTRAIHASKLHINIDGPAQPKLQTRLKRAPNEFNTWSQFMARCSTILDCQNTLFIVPMKNEARETVGIYPIIPSKAEIKEYKGEAWLQFEFPGHKRAVCELRDVGIMVKFQYWHEFKGEKNDALRETMRLIDLQNKAISEAVKSGASHRFFARVTNFMAPEDLAQEQERFDSYNASQGGGVLLFPNTYDNIHQVEPNNYIIDSKQKELIDKNVNDYFGVNEDVLQNKAYGDRWTAFYEGAIEPFAIQFSEVLNKMLFTPREQENTSIICTANRLQYMSNAEKLNVSTQLVDRGVLCRNEAREIFQLPPIPGGDDFMIRAEYVGTEENQTNE